MMQKLLFSTLAVLCVWPIAAQAGFELSGGGPSASVSSSSGQNIYPEGLLDEPMPIAAAPSVTAMPLENTASSDEVYIKRGVLTPLTPSEKEAVDSKGLLNAVENGHYIGMTSENPEAVLQKAPVDGKQGLVINPYPLKESATHTSIQAAPVEQAMMEQTGLLRPVMTPGKTRSAGMIERARKAAQKREQAQPQEKMASASVAPVDTMLLAPMPQTLDNAVPKPSLVQKPVISSSQAGLSAPVSQAAFQDAVGFGKELPLALALSQIVPPEYSYAFGQSVNTGEIVSWEGGKPWNVVLDEMIAPKGLKAVISGNQVLIQGRQS